MKAMLERPPTEEVGHTKTFSGSIIYPFSLFVVLLLLIVSWAGAPQVGRVRQASSPHAPNFVNVCPTVLQEQDAEELWPADASSAATPQQGTPDLSWSNIGATCQASIWPLQVHGPVQASEGAAGRLAAPSNSETQHTPLHTPIPLS